MRKILFITICFVILITGCYRGKTSVIIKTLTPSKEVTQRTNFTFAFSAPVAEPESLNKWYETPYIKFDPFVKGKYKWISSSELRFYPEDPLLPSTEYSLVLSPDIVKSERYYLRGKRRFIFNTERIRIENIESDFRISPKDVGKVRLTLSISFNYMVDPSDLAKNMKIEIEPDGEIDYIIEQKESSALLVVVSEPMEILKERKRINITISKGIKPPGGQLGLKEDYKAEFYSPEEKKLVIENVFPENSKYDNWITVRFSTPVSSDELKDYIKVSPEVTYNLERSNKNISIYGDFKTNKSYEIKIREGLTAMNGSRLERDFATNITMRDLEPSFNFIHEGIYLQKKGGLMVGIESVNIDELELSVEKVFRNNLIYFLNTNRMERTYVRYLDFLGKHIKTKKIEIEGEKNEKIMKTVDMSEFLEEDKKGIYILQLWRPESHWRRDMKWVIITDMGIIAKESGDELRVYVNSLKDLKSVEGAEVEIISRNNQTLVEGKTNSDGVAIFNDYHDKTLGFTPIAIIARKGDDFSFLKLDNSRIEMGDFDVGGRPPVEQYEAFTYTERGVYRPGDTVHIASIIRDKNREIPPKFPVIVMVKDPVQTNFEEFKGNTGESGADGFTLPIPNYARTGVYTIMVLVADSIEIGRTTFQVEEFMPARMEVDLKLDKKEYKTGEIVNADVKAMMLFGPPAAGRKVEASVTLNPIRFSSEGYSRFNFEDNDKKLTEIKRSLGEKKLDSEGKITFQYRLPSNLEPPSMIRGIIEATVFEISGRTVTSQKSINIHPYPCYIGLRRIGKGYAKKGEKVEIEFIVLSPDGKKAAPRDLLVKVYKINWNTILERDRNGYYYRSIKTRDLVKEDVVEYKGEVSLYSFIPYDNGSYMVKISDSDSDASSTIKFYVSSWGYTPWAMEHPDRLNIELDKDEYKPGDKAEVQIQSPFSGKLILTIERNGVLEQRIVMMEENTATITIPVKDKFKPNAYIVGTLIRSNEGLDIYSPLRAFGVSPILVKADENKLYINIDSPEKMEPKNNLEISVKVENGTGKTYMTVAAVDEGILQITGFNTPSPFDFFFGRRRLTVNTYDIYSLILPEISRTSKFSKPGGGFAAELPGRLLMPVNVRRVKPVALWSGIVKAKDGFARIKFKVPQFQGSLRLMVVGFDGNRFGSAEDRVIVSDPIVITPTFPRFISGNDEFEIPVAVYNQTGKEGDISLSLNADGPINIISNSEITERFKSNEERIIHFSVRALDRMGKVHFHLEASGMREKTETDVDLPLRPASPLISEFGSGMIEDNSKISINLKNGWIEGTTMFQLIVSPLPAIRYLEGLRFLLRYPHGCIEQTTSRVFPLLYFSDLAKVVDPDLFKDKSSDYFVREGIDKIIRMQLPGGGFAYWPGGSRESEWGTLYATHFLTEAKKAGYNIPKYTLIRAGRRLNKMLYEEMRYRDYRRIYYLQRKCYAVYILALMGDPDRSSMNYLRNNELYNLKGYSQFLLAGSFAFSGDMETARKLIPDEIAPSSADRETGGNFNSGTKANAIMLEILSEVDPENPSVPVLIKEIVEELKPGRYYTTQNNAYGFMAIGKALSKLGESNYTGKIIIGGELVEEFGTEDFRLIRENIEDNEVEVEKNGTGPCYYYWKMSGIKKDESVKEYDRQLQVRRTYLDNFGNPVNYGNINQGQLIVAKISMKALTDNLENVIISDLLPAGLEIENPRLQSREALPWVGSKSISPDYMDIRDDRINIYLDLRKLDEKEFYYMLRAVTVGNFVLPPIKAEAMYDPFKSSVANSGRISVK